MKRVLANMRIAICDSNDQEREKYYNMFSMLAKKHKINAEFVLYSTCEEMLFRFEDKQFMNVLFIEIQMPGMSGSEAARKLRGLNYKGEIVVLTALQDKQSLLAGYDAGALNYIIKNETPLNKIEEIFLQAREAVEFKDQKYILFTAANEWINIPINNIRYFEMYKRIVAVYYGNEKFDFYLYSFKRIEKLLAGTDFIRTHRSYIVALKEIEHLSYSALITRSGKSLPVGRTYYPLIKEALKNFEQIHTVI